MQVGSVLQRIMPSFTPGCHVSEHFHVVTPKMCQRNNWTFNEVAACEALCFILKGLRRPLELKGQFVRTRCVWEGKDRRIDLCLDG